MMTEENKIKNSRGLQMKSTASLKIKSHYFLKSKI